MKRIFVDTGAWYALVDQKDPDHAAAASLLRCDGKTKKRHGNYFLNLKTRISAIPTARVSRSWRPLRSMALFLLIGIF
jgi:predicted nucleic acid-binding protein